jgi:NADH-quinone oxidoreductase subunit E
MLRGGDELLQNLCHHLQVEPRKMSADGDFTIIPSECLGACDRAPMMLVDDKVVGPVDSDDLSKILQEAKLGPGHPCAAELLEADHV